MLRITKQLGMMRDGNKGWLKHVTPEERVFGSVMVNGATGGRCTHNNPNMAQVDRKDLRMMKCWVHKEWWGLVGCDASGLEL